MDLQLHLTRLDKLAQTLRSPWLLRVLLSTHVVASAEHRRVLDCEIGTVVDIGANKGQFSLAARQWAPNSRVFAFEPLPDAASTFRKVFQGDSRVTLYQVAIGPRAEEAAIHVSEADDSSSLLPISPLQISLHPGTGEVRTETVRVGRLSDYISASEIASPALLKLDVQGYELEALRGCEDLLRKFDLVVVECSFVELYEGQALAHEVTHFLQMNGFVLRNVYDLEYDPRGQAIQGDFLFGKTAPRKGVLDSDGSC